MSTKSSNSNAPSSCSDSDTDHHLAHELRLAKQDLHSVTNNACRALMHLRQVLEYKDSLISIIPDPDTPPNPLIPAPLLPTTLLRLSASTLRTLQTTDPTAPRHVTKQSILGTICDLLDDVDVLIVVADKKGEATGGEEVRSALERCVNSAVEYARLFDREADADGGAVVHQLQLGQGGDCSNSAGGESKGGSGWGEISGVQDDDVIPGSEKPQARMKGGDLEVTEAVGGGDDGKVDTDVEETFWDQQ